MPILNNMLDYLAMGAHSTFGIDPFTGPNNTQGRARMDGGRLSYTKQVANKVVEIGGGREWSDSRTNAFSPTGGGGLALGLGVLTTGYGVVTGYSEGGLGGAAQAAFLDVSVAAAAAKFSHKLTRLDKADRGPDGWTHKVEQRKMWTPFGKTWMGAYMGLAVGATVGANLASDLGETIGNAVGDGYTGSGLATVGSAAGTGLGAFAGAWATRALGRHPIIGTLGILGVMGAREVYKGTHEFVKSGYRKKQQTKGIDIAGDTAAFYTRAAVTMRQRAVQAIHKSHLNARSALGQEASFMHMPEKNYFSTYRRI